MIAKNGFKYLQIIYEEDDDFFTVPYIICSDHDLRYEPLCVYETFWVNLEDYDVESGNKIMKKYFGWTDVICTEILQPELKSAIENKKYKLIDVVSYTEFQDKIMDKIGNEELKKCFAKWKCDDRRYYWEILKHEVEAVYEIEVCYDWLVVQSFFEWCNNNHIPYEIEYEIPKTELLYGGNDPWIELKPFIIQKFNECPFEREEFKSLRNVVF